MICTATERNWGPRPAAIERGRDRVPGWLPVDEAAGLVGHASPAGAGLVVGVGLGLGLGLWRRRHD